MLRLDTVYVPVGSTATCYIFEYDVAQSGGMILDTLGVSDSSFNAHRFVQQSVDLLRK